MMIEVEALVHSALKAVQRLRPGPDSRPAVAGLAKIANRLGLQRRSSTQVASFLWPAGCFRHREALAPLVAAGDCGLLDGATAAGKRILCLVEADADTTIVRTLLRAAARIDFVLQSEHKIQIDLTNHNGQTDERYTFCIFDNIATTGSEIEIECSERNYKFFQSLSGYFDSIFGADPRLAKYRSFSSALAGYVEPLTYASCFVTPKIFETLVASHSPDVVILLCQDGRYFAPFLANLGQTAGAAPLLVGYSHHLASKRHDMAERIADLADCEWRWLKGPRKRSVAAGVAEQPKAQIAAAIERLDTATETALMRFRPELTYKRCYGAVTTVQAGHVSYNYAFRQRLLERLVKTFDLNLFLLDAAPAAQQMLQAELQAAGNGFRGNTRLVPYAASSRDIHDALALMLDGQRAVWQSKLVELAGGDWVLPVFETLVLDWMVDLIAAGLEYASFLRALFRSYPPAFALAITGQTPSAEILLTAARQAAVPTFDMQIVAIFDHPHTQTTLPPKADHFFALDTQSADLLAAWGWPPDRLYVNGSVRFDQLQSLDVASHRGRGQAVFAGQIFTHFIGFISQALSFESCRIVLQVVARVIATMPDTALIVKLHPQEPGGNRRAYENILKDLAPAKNWRVMGDIDIDTVLCTSDLVIGLYSSALLEAACLRKPVIAANLTGKRFLEPTNFGDRACILGATSEGEIARLIPLILDDEAFRTATLARQGDYLRQHAYMVDGGALERIVRTIGEVVEDQPVSARSYAAWRPAPTARRASE